MARKPGRLEGKLYADAESEHGPVIWVYKRGALFEIQFGGQTHLCHRSVQNIDHVKREAFHVFGVKAELFEACY